VWLRWGTLGNVEGLLKTVEFFGKSISKGYLHLEVRIRKEHVESMCILVWITLSSLVCKMLDFLGPAIISFLTKNK
jgi:hypothetical protein